MIAGHTHEESEKIAYSAQFVDCCSRTLLAKVGGPRAAATTQLQLELMDASMIDPIKDELFRSARRLLEGNGCHTVLFLATDIMREGSQLLVVSRDLSVTEKAFSVSLEPYKLAKLRKSAPAYSKGEDSDYHQQNPSSGTPWADHLGQQWMPGMMSRKKQVLPFLMEAFNSLD
jgi:inorganic pyrophosphatase/exopolyphosphatase